MVSGDSIQPNSEQRRARNSELRTWHRLLLLPVFDAESGDAGKLGDIVGHEGQAVGKGGRGDQKIIRSDGPSLTLQVGPDVAVDIGGVGIERQTGQRLAERIHQSEVCSNMPALACPEHKLRSDDRAHGDLAGFEPLEPVNHSS